jgi:hypothetical protein
MGRFPQNYSDKDDCLVLRMRGKDSDVIEVSFPFHEDTPNFWLTIPEALDLKNAIDQLIDLKMLEKPRGN